MQNLEVDPSQVHSIEVDPSQVSKALQAQTAPVGSTASRAASNFWDNTVGGLSNTGKLLYHVATSIPSALITGEPSEGLTKDLKGIIDAHVGQWQKAKDAYDKGQYAEAAGHGLATAIPMLGPTAAAIGEKIGGTDPVMDKYGNIVQSGQAPDIAGGVGGAAGMFASLIAPEAASRIAAKLPANARVPIVPKAAALDPALQTARDFAERNNIPISAATATGNAYVSGLQKVVDHSPVGSVIANRARNAEATAMTRVGGELADQVHPDPTTPLEAGSAVTGGLMDNIRREAATENQHYGTLEEIAADPINQQTIKQTRTSPSEQMALPVDTLAAQRQLKPILDAMTRQMSPLQEQASAGIKVLRGIVEGPRFVPAVTLDRDLGAIKGIVRGSVEDMPQLRTLSQGLAASTIGSLERGVQDALSKARRSGTLGADADAASATPSPTQEANPGGTGEGPQVYSPSGPGNPDAAQTRVTVPGESRAYAARYAVKELEDIQPSHNGQTFQPNSKYGIRNDRDYKDQVNQGKIVDWSTPAKFDPSYHITDNGDAVNGPIVTDSEGNALGGNGRAMILQRVYAGNPKGAAAYRDLLMQKAQQFGQDPAAIAQMKRPVLTRVIDDSEFQPGAGNKANAVTDFNKTGTAALTPAERAIADSRRVSPDTMENIGNRMDQAGPDATLSQVLEGKSGTEVLQNLIDDKVISPQERASLGDENALTPAGKDRISKLMLGRYFENASQMDSFPAAMKNKLERVAPLLARTEGSGGFGLSGDMQQAVSLLEDYRKSGASTWGDYDSQQGLFGNQKFSPVARTLAEALQKSTPNALTQAVRTYADHAKYAAEYQGPGMFQEFPDPKTPNGAVNDAFGASNPEPRSGPMLSDLGNQQPGSTAPAAASTPAQATPAPTAPAGIPAGAEALNALKEGRAAVVRKYEAADIRNALPNKGDEGVSVYQRLTQSKDARLGQLLDIKAQTPEQIPKIGRAALDDILNTQSLDGMRRGDGMLKRWDDMGARTKEILYPNPALRRDLDGFFLLAKKAGANVNPSNTAAVSMIAGWTLHGGITFHDLATGGMVTVSTGVLSKMLHSPAGVAALTKGFSVPARGGVAAAVASARILQLAKAAGQPAAVPSSRPLAAQASPPEQSDTTPLVASR